MKMKLKFIFSVLSLFVIFLFSNNLVLAQTSLLNKEIYIFVDSTTYNALSSKINRLATDIKTDLGSKVIIRSGNYSSPMEIRSILKQAYENKILAGSVLIGSIPTFERNDGFYTDWFYQELDDSCTISAEGIFSLSCNRFDSVSKRDVFTGRIMPPVNATNTIALIEKYLDKNHAYRQGRIIFPKKMLLYPSVSILERNRGKSSSKNSLLENINFSINSQFRYSLDDVDVITETDYLKQKQNYLSKLKDNRYETALINIHGSENSQFPSQKYDESQIFSTDINEVTPNIFYIALLSCSNGAFKSPDYLAGKFLFNGDTLLVTAHSQITAIGSFLEDPPVSPIFFQRLSFLNSSVPLGQMFINDSSLFITQVFGDPTLAIRGNSIIPQLEISSKDIDFGSMIDQETNQLSNKIFSVKNVSNSVAKILVLPSWGIVLEKEYFFDPSNPVTVVPGRNYLGFNISDINPYDVIDIQPKQKVDFNFSFSPAMRSNDGNIIGGNYSDTYSLITTDPTQPIIDINLKAFQKIIKINSISPTFITSNDLLTINGVGFSTDTANIVTLKSPDDICPSGFVCDRTRQYKVVSKDGNTLDFITNIIPGNYKVQVLHPVNGASNIVYVTISTSTTSSTQAVSPDRETANSGQVVKLNYSIPAHSVSAKLMLYCPEGVTGKIASKDMCNQWLNFPTLPTETDVIFINKSDLPQYVVPNFYIYYENDPNYAIGVSSQVKVLPQLTSNTPAPTPAPILGDGILSKVIDNSRKVFEPTLRRAVSIIIPTQITPPPAIFSPTPSPVTNSTASASPSPNQTIKPSSSVTPKPNAIITPSFPVSSGTPTPSPTEFRCNSSQCAVAYCPSGTSVQLSLGKRGNYTYTTNSVTYCSEPYSPFNQYPYTVSKTSVVNACSLSKTEAQKLANQSVSLNCKTSSPTPSITITQTPTITPTPTIIVSPSPYTSPTPPTTVLPSSSPSSSPVLDPSPLSPPPSSPPPSVPTSPPPSLIVSPSSSPASTTPPPESSPLSSPITSPSASLDQNSLASVFEAITEWLGW